MTRRWVPVILCLASGCGVAWSWPQHFELQRQLHISTAVALSAAGDRLAYTAWSGDSGGRLHVVDLRTGSNMCVGEAPPDRPGILTDGGDCYKYLDGWGRLARLDLTTFERHDTGVLGPGAAALLGRWDESRVVAAERVGRFWHAHVVGSHGDEGCLLGERFHAEHPDAVPLFWRARDRVLGLAEGEHLLVVTAREPGSSPRASELALPGGRGKLVAAASAIADEIWFARAPGRRIEVAVRDHHSGEWRTDGAWDAPTHTARVAYLPWLSPPNLAVGVRPGRAACAVGRRAAVLERGKTDPLWVAPGEPTPEEANRAGLGGGLGVSIVPSDHPCGSTLPEIVAYALADVSGPAERDGIAGLKERLGSELASGDAMSQPTAADVMRAIESAIAALGLRVRVDVRVRTACSHDQRAVWGPLEVDSRLGGPTTAIVALVLTDTAAADGLAAAMDSPVHEAARCTGISSFPGGEGPGRLCLSGARPYRGDLWSPDGASNVVYLIASVR